MKINFKAVWPYVVHKSKSRYDVYIGRPSKWGNMYSHQEGTLAEFKVETREEAIEKYKQYVLSNPQIISDIKKELKGKVLGCYCSPKMCHGHILAAIANDIIEED